jgi:hypothetical protein
MMNLATAEDLAQWARQAKSALRRAARQVRAGKKQARRARRKAQWRGRK